MNTEVEPLEFPTVDPYDQKDVEHEFIESAKSARRVAGGIKAAETRRKKAEAAKPQPQAGGITAERSLWFRTFPRRLAAKREEFAAVERELENMESEWDAAIDSLPVKP